MKKQFCRILCMLLSVLLCASSACAELQVIDLSASEETIRYRETTIFATNDARAMNDEQMLAFYDSVIATLQGRTEHVFPASETTYTPVKEENLAGDVYSLSNGKEYDCIIMYIHGGAWVMELDPEHARFCDKLVDLFSAKVYMPLYPLAPQATAEEGFAMLQATYEALLQEGKPVYLMGDSAGATLTLGLTLLLKDAGITLPEKVVVMAPCADASFSNPEILELQKKDGMLPYLYCRNCAALWAGEWEISCPQISPITGDYTGFPETLMYIGSCDILYSDDHLLAQKMSDSGVDVTLVNGEGFWHVYPVDNVAETPRIMEILENFILGKAQ